MTAILSSYIIKHVKSVLLYLTFTGIFLVIFYLYGIRMDAVSYAFLLSMTGVCILTGIDFIQYYHRHRRLEAAEQSIATELKELPKPKDLQEADYQRIIQRLYDCKVAMESEKAIASQDMLDYYSLWVHQIKTPISAMGLLLQSGVAEEFEEFNKRRQALKMELFKVEQYVEMVMSYLRMETMTSDLVLQWHSLDEIIKQVIHKYSQTFILKKIKLEFHESGERVLTDEKWLSFVLEQVLSNALKYTKEGTIGIYMQKDEKQTLVIADTGIGIWDEDLPRVFEKGFTGYNGRIDKKSTGIGLYLCKTIMEKLNHPLTITSRMDVGTKVYIDLYRKEWNVE